MEISVKKTYLTNIMTRIVPYLFIILMSLLSGYTLFFKGLPSGDDAWFHLTQIEDLYLGFTRGFWGLSTNHTLFGIFALDNYGFYGPLPHYSAAMIMYACNGLDATIAVKIVLFASFILGATYTYLLSKKITNNVPLSLIAALLFTLLPYRMFSALARQAFSEVIALSFVPMIFYALYRILHDERFYILPYITLILGAMGVVLSHPFTALLTATFAIIYLIFNFKLLFKKRVGYNVIIMFVLSGMFILFGVLFYVLLALDTKNSNIFRFCFEETSWTSLDFVLNSIDHSPQYAGFLNQSWLNNVVLLPTWVSGSIEFIYLGILYFFMSLAVLIFGDLILQSLPKNKYYRYIVDLILVLIVPLATNQRAEVYIGISFAYIFFLIASLIKDNHLESKEETDKFSFKKYLNPELLFYLTATVICLVLIFSKGIWYIVPSIYRECQFAWRIYGVLSFVLTMLIIYLLKPFKDKKAPIFTFGLLICSIFPLSQAPLEKRVSYESLGAPTWTEMNEEFLINNCTYSGALNEMVPNVFYDDNYESEYDNSLYKNIKYRIRNRVNFVYTIEEYITPSILKGEVEEIKITKLLTPDTSFDVKIISTDTLIQLPQFYQNGYYATFTNKETNEQTTVKGINIDGLLAFNFNANGNYQMDVDFKRCEAYQIFRPMFYMSLIGLIPLGIWGYKYRKELENKEAKK